jgi:hypothetical protein
VGYLQQQACTYKHNKQGKQQHLLLQLQHETSNKKKPTCNGVLPGWAGHGSAHLRLSQSETATACCVLIQY